MTHYQKVKREREHERRIQKDLRQTKLEEATAIADLSDRLLKGQPKAYSYDMYRHDYCSFTEFFGQFVTERMIRMIAQKIGVDRIVQSTDKHFNDIPIKLWDDLPIGDYLNKTLFLAAYNKDHISYAPYVGVCIAKTAARVIKHRLTTFKEGAEHDTTSNT